MPVSPTPKLQLPRIDQNQAGADVTHNLAVLMLDSIVARQALTWGNNAPPGSPVDGDLHLVGSAPTGAWAGHASAVAIYMAGWYFFSPNNGMILMDLSGGIGAHRLMVLINNAWAQITVP